MEAFFMRKTWRKIVSIILAITMISIILVGCGTKKTAEQSEKEQTQTEQSQTEQKQTSQSSSKNDFNEWQPFVIKAGEYYKYKTKITQEDGQVKEGWFSMKISGEGEDQLTVEAEGENGADKFAFTTTENKDNVFGSMMMSMFANPASQHVFSTIYSPFMGGGMWLMGISQGNVKIGNKWSYTFEGRSATSEVVGKRSYAGVEGYYMRYTVDGEVESEVCMSPRLPLALMSYMKMDGVKYESELVEYKS
jgi:hypothetical protein